MALNNPAWTGDSESQLYLYIAKQWKQEDIYWIGATRTDQARHGRRLALATHTSSSSAVAPPGTTQEEERTSSVVAPQGTTQEDTQARVVVVDLQPSGLRPECTTAHYTMAPRSQAQTGQSERQPLLCPDAAMIEETITTGNSDILPASIGKRATMPCVDHPYCLMTCTANSNTPQPPTPGRSRVDYYHCLEEPDSPVTSTDSGAAVVADSWPVEPPATTESLPVDLPVAAGPLPVE